MLLEGKVAVITGGNSGIGRATALRFVQEGAKVAITYHNNPQTADETETLAGKELLKLRCDVRKVDDIEEMINSTVREYSKIDILVNSAGYLKPKLLSEVTESDFYETIDTHLKGTYFCIQKTASYMPRGGSIINLSSIRGYKGRKALSLYGMAKAAIINLTQSLAVELAPHGIRVNAVAPGAIKTPLNEGLPEETKRKIDLRTPLGRRGEPEEVAEVILYLASDRAAYVTGSTHLIDGGLYSADVLD